MKGVCDNQYIHVQMIEKRSRKSACISGWKYVMLIHILTFYGNKYDVKKKTIKRPLSHFSQSMGEITCNLFCMKKDS